MAGLISRFRTLPALERRLVVEACFALAVAAFSIAVFPFHRIAAAAARHSVTAPDGVDHRALIQQIGWAVSACARRLPWRAKCFEQGLAAQWMLGRRNIAATLHYGIARQADGDLMAHVWVRSEDHDVIGCEHQMDFTELAQFPRNHSS